jgi:hypothetical protein
VRAWKIRIRISIVIVVRRSKRLTLWCILQTLPNQNQRIEMAYVDNSIAGKFKSFAVGAQNSIAGLMSSPQNDAPVAGENRWMAKVR